jgi:hypothetical protein
VLPTHAAAVAVSSKWSTRSGIAGFLLRCNAPTRLPGAHLFDLPARCMPAALSLCRRCRADARARAAAV